MLKLAFSFCGGVLLAHVYMQSRKHRLSHYGGLALLILLISLASAIKNDYIVLPDLPLISDKWNWYGLLAIIMVYTVLITRFRVASSVRHFLKQYGEVSYSTYLLHNLFIGLSVLLIVHLEVHNGYLKLLLTFLLTFLGSYLLAIYSYRFIEQPSIRIGKRVAIRVAGRLSGHLQQNMSTTSRHSVFESGK